MENMSQRRWQGGGGGSETENKLLLLSLAKCRSGSVIISFIVLKLLKAIQPEINGLLMLFLNEETFPLSKRH